MIVDHLKRRELLLRWCKGESLKSLAESINTTEYAIEIILNLVPKPNQGLL